MVWEGESAIAITIFIGVWPNGMLFSFKEVNTKQRHLKMEQGATTFQQSNTVELISRGRPEPLSAAEASIYLFAYRITIHSLLPTENPGAG